MQHEFIDNTSVIHIRSSLYVSNTEYINIHVCGLMVLITVKSVQAAYDKH